MKRWVCPLCGAGCLAPERPRSDDVRGYCLPCAKKTGKLVRRACPSLDKERAKRRSARLEDAKVDRAKTRERELAHWTVAGLDVRQVAFECWKALGERRACRTDSGADYYNVNAKLPDIKIRRTYKAHSSGRAWSHRVVLTFGHAVDQAKVWELVLHELAHPAAGIWHQHDETFNRTMSAAAVKLWELGMPIQRGYAPSRWLEKALRARFAKEGQGS